MFHFAALLVFQSVKGGVPLLPPPVPPLKEAGNDRQLSWAEVLLDAVRSDVSPETERCLSTLQREIEVICGMFAFLSEVLRVR